MAFAVVAAVLMVTTPVAGATSLQDLQSSGEAIPSDNIEPAQSQFQTADGSDARILNFNQESGDFEAGDRVTAEVEVRNTGESEHTFFVGYSVEGPDGNWYDNNEQTGKTVTLEPNEREWISLSWTVEDDAPTGDYDAVTSVWAESDRDNLQTRLDNERRDNALEVVEPTEIDAQILDFDVDSGEYREGESVDATATVENTGNTEHTFFVGYSTIGPDGDYYDNNEETGRTVTLAPGEQRSISLEWTVESDSPAGDYDARTSIWEESDRDNLQTRLGDSRRDNAFEVVEPTEIDAEIVDADVESGEFRQGDTVDATAVVENTGNTEHTFFVGYSAISPDGDYYDNNEETGRTVTLDPGEQRSISLDWTVEEDAPDGDYDARISIWEENDRDNLQTRLDDVRRNNAFEVVEPTEIDAQIVDFEVESGEFKQGESVDATAVVENTGNTEHTFFVGYSTIGPDGDYYDNNEGTGRRVTLDPGEQRSVSLGWSVESNAQGGDYDARTSIWEESDRDNLRTRLDDSRRDNVFELVEPTEIDARMVNADVESGEFRQGDSVDATAVVENTGNTEHTFFVGYSVISPDGDYYDNNEHTGRTITLESGEERSVSLDWTVEEGIPSGDYDTRISIWGESDRDNLQTRLDDIRRNNAFEVVKPSEVDARLVDFGVESGEFRQGDSVGATAVVENTGNTEHTFFVGYSTIGPDGDYYDNNEETGRTVALDPGEQQSVSLEWVVEDIAPTGDYDAQAVIWKESDRNSLQTRLDEDRRNEAFRVAATTGTVNGIVVDSSGEPLSDATVRIDSESTMTDSSGQFTLSDISSGEHTIVATAPGYTQTTVSITVESGQVSERISLSPNPASISDLDPPASYHPGETVEVGVMVRPEGDGTTTYEVAIPRQDGVEIISENPREVSIPAGTAAKQIEFQVQFTERRESQSISAELRAPGGGKVLDSASGTTTATQTSLTVEAVTEQGEPVAGAEFELLAADRPSQTTDASGSVTFRGLVGGEYVLLGSDDTRDAYPSNEVTVTADDQNTVTVRFPAKARVEGKVTADGEPLSGALISIGSESQRVTEEGEFRIGTEFQTGRHELTVKHRGDVVLREQVDLHAGRNTYDLTVDPVALDVAETESGDVEEVDRAELMASVDKGTVMAGMGTTTDPASDSIWYNLGSSGEFWSNRDGSYHTSGPCAFYHDRPGATNEFRQDFCGSTRPADDETHPAVMRHGAHSGFATGLGESVESVEQTIESAQKPVETAQAFVSFVFKIANDLGLLEELISALPESVKEQQREDNPYPAESSENRSFRAGWYGGYGGYQVVTVVASAGAGKAISSSSRLSRTASKFDSYSREKKKQLLRRGSATRRLADHGLSDDATRFISEHQRPMRANWLSQQKMARWLDEIEDVDGSDRVVQNMNSEINGPDANYDFDQLQGAMGRLFEPKAAANYQRNVKDIRELDHERAGAVRQNGEYKPIEVDMISEDGDLIETKSSSKFQSIDTNDGRYDDLDAKLERFQKYKRSEGYDGNLGVVFRVQPSDDVYDLLTSKYDANCWVTTQDGGIVPCKR